MSDEDRDPALAERVGEVVERLREGMPETFDATEGYAPSVSLAEERMADAADLITALRAERDETYAYAKHLVEAIFANGKFDAPQWEPLEDTLGVLTQIDNMVAGIRALPARGVGANQSQVIAICEAWVADGRGDECFWEGWPDQPQCEGLTPNMVLAALEPNK